MTPRGSGDNVGVYSHVFISVAALFQNTITVLTDITKTHK
jgi:hypothetical protein